MGTWRTLVGAGFVMIGLAACGDSISEPDQIEVAAVAASLQELTDPCAADLTLTTQAEVDAFACTTVDGALWIGPSTDIANIDALAGLVRVEGDLVLTFNPVLTDVNGLSSLTSAGRLVIGLNNALTDVSGLSTLTSVDRLLLMGPNAALTSLDGLSSLAAAPELEFSGTSLRRLELPALRVTKTVQIELNDALTDIALPSLESIEFAGRMTLTRNPALTDLSLPSLTNVGLLVIHDNDGLEDVDGFSSLSSAGQLVIGDNATLGNIDGLSRLTKVEVGLFVYRNDALADVDGLAGLTSVGNPLQITDNPALANCACGLYGLLAAGGATGSVTIENNAPGCNSVQALTAKACVDCAGSDLMAHIRGLVKDGVLGKSVGNRLSNPLTTAMKHATKAHFTIAQRKLEGFIALVIDLQETGRIGSDTAAALVADADLMLKAIRALI